MARASQTLLIFDCDGVLVDSEYLFARVTRDCLAAIGVEVLEADTARFAGVSVKDILAGVERDYHCSLPPGFEAIIDQREAEAYRQELEAIAGVREAILAMPHRRCVASSSTPDRIAGSLLTAGLDDLFEPDARFSTALVRNGKPAPDIFLHAAAAMGHHPQRCIVIEDLVPGVTGAIAAGMNVVGFCGGRHCLTDHSERLERAGAHRVIADMVELPETVAELIARGM